jgi:hypothetical protein
MNTDQVSGPSLKEIRQFGLILGVILAGVFGLVVPWAKGATLPVWPWVPAVVLWLAVAFLPGWLRPVYRVWMRLAMVINVVITRVVLGIVYYLIVFPIGWVMRLTGKDPMARQWMTTLRSYRAPSPPSVSIDMEKPF